MNKTVKSLLAVSLLASGAAHAGVATDKTFLNPRSPGVDLARQQTIWHRQLHRPKKDDYFGGHFQATGYYKNSTNKSTQGRYFGFKGINKHENVLTVGQPNGVDIDSRHFIHNLTSGTEETANTLEGTLKLAFEQEVWGVELSYFQNLDSIYKGLYFMVNLPINHVMNRPKVSVSKNATKQTITLMNGDSKEVGILDFFRGEISQKFGANGTQQPLKKAKIRGSHDETGVGDLEFKFGWDFYRTEDHHVGFNFGIVLPTSNDADGTYLFEPFSGNGSHWAPGCGITAAFIPWRRDNQEIEIVFIFDYRYLIENDEMRTVGLKNKTWGHYQLIAEKGKNMVMPAANVLTRKVDVEPGSQINSMFNFAYHYDNFTFNIGYELFARESERVHVKNWCEDTYAFVGNDYNPAGAAFVINTDAAPLTSDIGKTQASVVTGGEAIKKDDLDATKARTPGFATHKIFAAIGHDWRDWDYPLMLKFGGYYEFAPSRKALDNWSIFGGFGVGF